MAASDRIAGYHDLYWMEYGVSTGAVLLGGTGPEGIQLELEEASTPIMGDALGPSTIIDHVNQGGNCILSFVIQEVKLAVVRKFMNPWTQSTGTPTYGEFRIGTPGALASQSAYGTLQAIPRTSTPAASYNASGGSGLQFSGMRVGPRRFTLDTNPRYVPVRFQCVPFDIGSGDLGWAKWITAAS